MDRKERMMNHQRRFTRRQILKLGALGGTLGAAALLFPTIGARGVNAGAAAQTITGTIDGADFRIQVPDTWTGDLLLYSHGMVLPGQPNPAMAVSDPVTGQALLDMGYALAGSSYRTTGYAADDAFHDQIALLDLFARQVGTPDRTIAWGDSLGGLISAGLVQRNPERIAGALPMCGGLLGSVALWNAFLDIQYAFKTLLAPNDMDLQIVRIADANANFQRALGITQTAQQSPAGKARLALINALYPTSDAHTPPPPMPTYGNRPLSPQEIVSYVFRYSALGLAFGVRADMEARAGGNPSFNTGVSYRELFRLSPQSGRIPPLYEQAGLDLDADLEALEGGSRIAADPQALDYLRRYIVFDGAITRPVLALHTIGDPVMPVAAEQAYANTVQAAGMGSMLRQAFVDRAGHVLFTPAERLAALAQLAWRIEAGRWDNDDLSPASLNAAANRFGASANALTDPYSGAMDPAFAAFEPPPFARAFDARTPDPTT
jgi:hypothetical protein